MKFLSYFHDPDDLFLDLLEQTSFPKELKGSIVAVSPQTTIKAYNLVKELGFKIVEGGPYGYARIASLKEGLKENDNSYFFVCDFDKMLHWIIEDKQEFLKVLNSIPKAAYTVVARSEKALDSYPSSWIETEQIVTRIIGKILGGRFDIMNGPIILNRKASEVVVENAVETGVGSCAEWALLAKLAKLKIDEIKVNGLTWEDPDRYKLLIEKSDSYETWKEEAFNSLYEWRKRVEFLHQQVNTMIRLTSEPINPKYPAVKNKIFL